MNWDNSDYVNAFLINIEPAGVYVTIMGANVENDGYVSIDLLNPDDVTLECITNLTNCCNNRTTMTGPVGDWYFPDGSTVMSKKDIIISDSPYFVRNRGISKLRLFIERNITANSSTTSPPERGRFRCEVPNSEGKNQTYYINICM